MPTITVKLDMKRAARVARWARSRVSVVETKVCVERAREPDILPV